MGWRTYLASTHLLFPLGIRGPLRQPECSLRSAPARIHSDQGRNFESSLLQQLCSLYHIERCRTTSYIPLATVSVKVSTVRSMTYLALYPPPVHRNGTLVCLRCCTGINKTPHQSTGESPLFLMFSHESRLPVDFLLGRVQDTIGRIVNDWVQEHRTRLRLAFEGVQEKLKSSLEGAP